MGQPKCQPDIPARGTYFGTYSRKKLPRVERRSKVRICSERSILTETTGASLAGPGLSFVGGFLVLLLRATGHPSFYSTNYLLATCVMGRSGRIKSMPKCRIRAADEVNSRKLFARRYPITKTSGSVVIQ